MEQLDIAFWSTAAQMAVVIGLAVTLQGRNLLNRTEFKEERKGRIFVTLIYFSTQIVLLISILQSIDFLSNGNKKSKSFMEFGIKTGIYLLILTPSVQLLIKGFNEISAKFFWWVLDVEIPIRNFIWNNDLSWQRRKLRKSIGIQALRIEKSIESTNEIIQEIKNSTKLNRGEKAKYLKRAKVILDEAIGTREASLELNKKLEDQNIFKRTNHSAEEAAELKRSLATFLRDYDQFGSEYKELKNSQIK